MNDIAYRFEYADGSAFEVQFDGRAFISFPNGRREEKRGKITNNIPPQTGIPAQRQTADLDAMIQRGLDAADLYELGVNDVITKKHLRAFLSAALSVAPAERPTVYVDTLENLVQCLIDNDPDEVAADGGVTVLDVWRKDAERALASRSPAASATNDRWNEALEEAANIANRFGDCPGHEVADRIFEFAAETREKPPASAKPDSHSPAAAAAEQPTIKRSSEADAYYKILQTIARFPITDPKNMDAVNMRMIAEEALALAPAGRSSPAAIGTKEQIAAQVLLAMSDKAGADTYGVSYALKINTARAEKAAESILALRSQPENESEQVCAEAYQVVASLLSDLGQYDTEPGQKILDNLSQAKMVHSDVLPWPSFENPKP